MRLSLSPAPVLLLAAAVAACAPARGPSPLEQEAAYARTPGQTLHYREVSRSSSRIGMGMPAPDGEASRAVHDVRLAIRFTDGDQAQVWIEPPRTGRPATEADPREPPFTLRMGPRGIESIAAPPELPRTRPGVADQLRDFFPRLPGGPLSRGRQWDESSTRDLSDKDWTGTQTRTVHYRVVGSDAIGGERVIVAEYELLTRSQLRGRQTMRYDPGMPYYPPAGASTYQTERGRIYFAPRTGRFVRRSGSGVREQSRSAYATEAAVQVTEYTITSELISSAYQKKNHRTEEQSQTEKTS
ncbi:MAG TPA: hypothetical protein VGC13_08530 [Longimicrobium sp.]|jgi:hypothetical protein|uniref:hypothetical protein n=1 Tax=Longimicrobium sp. TaxID=2029185 RepID=UPI002EDA1DF0